MSSENFKSSIFPVFALQKFQKLSISVVCLDPTSQGLESPEMRGWFKEIVKHTKITKRRKKEIQSFLLAQVHRLPPSEKVSHSLKRKRSRNQRQTSMIVSYRKHATNNNGNKKQNPTQEGTDEKKKVRRAFLWSEGKWAGAQ
ncbi:hypothetical protein AVEN_115270-1 [Araneus ventricosus]|uniref:Uncharacterized protein n=1 Tax=Araneus ventricosus TaxID=182803 RepID=A0A4Y1ZXV5_ARAVE|nr:hypothetical protein AVEN_115270-1 [Araneus ventricosus]